MQGFAMHQGVLSNQRVRLLLAIGHKSYRPRRDGERKRKSVRGCIVGADLSVLNLVIVKKGEKDIPGLTDVSKPRRLGPKRASRIRKLFNLTGDDDVRQYVIRRQIVRDGKKPYTKAPKIQRLITPQRLQHKRARKAEKRTRYEKSKTLAAAYNELISQRLKEASAARKAQVTKKRSQSRKESQKGDAAAPAPAPAAAAAAAPKTQPKQPKQPKPAKPQQAKPAKAQAKQQAKPQAK